MSYGGIYRLPPQPQQRLPGVPIPAQGDQPPPRLNVALAMSLVMASWPTGLEHNPQQRLPTVPIPAQGDQPPQRTNAPAMSLVQASWPTGFEHQPQQRLPTAPIGQAAIAFDAAGTNGYVAASAEYVFSRTCTGTNLHLAVDVAVLDSAAITVASVTDDDGGGNVPMVSIGRSARPGFGSVSSWSLAAPSPGTKNVRVIINGTVASIANWVSRTGVNQATPFNPNNVTTSHGIDDPASGNITTTTNGSWIHAAVVSDDTSITAALTSRNNVSGALGSAADQDFGPSVPDTYAVSWNGIDAGKVWAIIRYELLASVPAAADNPASSPARLLGILRSWIPPDPMPQQQRRDIAPLTLAYGDQPPLQSTVNSTTVVAAWKAADPQPQQRLPTVPIPAQGDQPPPQSRSAAILTAWYVEQPIQQPQRFIAAIIPAEAAEQPAFIRQPESVLAAWDAGPPLRIAETRIAPLTLDYGDQPPRATPATLYALVQSWIPPPPEPQQRLTTIPIGDQGDQPPRYSLAIVNAVVSAWIPPPPEPWHGRRDIAPLTLAQGDQPPRFSTTALFGILNSWIPPEPQPQQRLTTAPIPEQGDQPPRQTRHPVFISDAQQPQQRQAQVAAIIPAAVADQPFTRQLDSILAAWQQDVQPPRRLPTLPIAAQGDQPPRFSASVLFGILETWLPPPPAPQQQRRDLAPLTLSYGEQPPVPSTAGLNAILRSWIPPEPQPQQGRRDIAPLTLSYGDSFPVFSNDEFFSILRSWLPPDPMPQQQRRDIAPLTLDYGDQPPPLSRQLAYTEEAIQPQQRQTFVAAVIPAVVEEQPAFTPYPFALIAAWVSPDHQPQRLPAVPIPAQGDQPPRVNAALSMSLVVASWPTGLEYQPYQRAPTVPIPAQGDQPPRYSTVSLNTVLIAWIPPPYIHSPPVFAVPQPLPSGSPEDCWIAQGTGRVYESQATGRVFIAQPTGRVWIGEDT